jgi:hypothetical protein
LALLADDVPPLRSVRPRLLDRIERRRPYWLAGSQGFPHDLALASFGFASPRRVLGLIVACRAP